MTTLDISTLYVTTGQAKLDALPDYEISAKAAIPPGDDATLTGPGPVWLYLRLGHALHGHCRSLHYESPVTGPVLIFDHNPR